MFVLHILLEAEFFFQGSPLHAPPQASPTPVPHWIVLLVAVPTLWLVIGGAVLIIDRSLQRF